MVKTEIKISIPDNISDITLAQHNELMYYADRLGENDTSIKLRIISIVCGIPFSYVKEGFSAKDINKTYKDINKILLELSKSEPDTVLRFKHNGVEYGFIPDFANLSAGEFMDVSEYLKDRSTYARAMQVLYRPIVKEKYNKYLKIMQYEIKPYNGTDDRLDFSSLPMITVKSAIFFLTRSLKQLLPIFQSFLEKELKKPGNKKRLKQQKVDLAESMDGVSRLIDYLEATF